MPRKLKVKIHEAVVRPVMVSGGELWTMRKKEVRLLGTTEMRMLRRIRGASLGDRMRSGDIIRGVRSITSRLREGRLRWLGHVKRMGNNNWVRKTMDLELEVEGRKKGER